MNSGYRYPLAHVNYDIREIDAVVKILRDGQTTCGPQVQAFEQSFAKYVGADHATMVNSGSSADLLVAFGLGEPDDRDEILVPAVTWPTQIWSCLMAGYKVRLIDVSVDTLQMDLIDLRRHLSDKTRAIFLTHLMGNVGDIEQIDQIRDEHGNVDIIEDCCEALGARFDGRHVGNLGKASAFSFFFSHLINTMEGGMVVCNTAEDDQNYRLLRSHGWQPQPDCKFWFPTWGFNIRPTEVQGAFGVIQMTKLEQFRKHRNHNATFLDSMIKGKFNKYLQTMCILPNVEPSWHGFPILIKNADSAEKDRLCAYLEKNGIETRPIVAGNISRQVAVRKFAQDRIHYGHLPGADIIHNQGFYIGVASFEDNSGVSYVMDVLDRYDW